MKSREFRERMLIALVEKAKATSRGAFLDPAEVADEARLERQPGQLRVVIDELETRGLANVSRTMGGGDEGGLDLRLTNAAFEESEELLEDHPEYGEPVPPPPIAPMPGRYVTVSEDTKAEIAADLADLRRTVASTNDVADDVREAALSEIAAFEGTIIQSRVAVELIDRFVNRILAWLRTKFPEAVLGGIVGLLIERLLPLAT